MKKIFMAFAAWACVLSGCSDDDNAQTAPEVVDSINISTETISAGPEGADDCAVVVTSSADWRLTGHCDWAEPSAVAGKSGDEVVFTIEPNETGVRREATFKFFTGSVIVPLKVISEPTYVLELLSKKAETFKTNSSTYQVILNTNVPELSHDIVFEDAEEGAEPWITYIERREGYGKTTLNFAIAENKGYMARKARLTIDSEETETPIEITFEQSMVEYCNVVAEDAYSFDLTERTFKIRIETSVEYEFEQGKRSDWITAGEPELISDEKGLRTEELTIHLDAAESSRKGTFQIRQKDQIWGDPLAEITVQQRDPNAVYADIEDDNFRTWLLDYEWIEEEEDGLYVVTKTGKTETTIENNKPNRYYKWESLKGIEAFPQIEEIHVNKHNFKTLDISMLYKVRVLECEQNSQLSTIILGQNPISEFSVYTGDTIDDYDFTVLTISGEKVETIDVGLEDPDYDGPYDDLETLDVSGCPALKTLNCIRGDKLTKLILKQGQAIPNLKKKDTTIIEYK
ncbi:hypothetical protein B5E60_02945 [Alistipes sp. An116]|uniref:BACON domain-containing protein n=1 Tax=Alistipes sp. An116 TaxID=1965546 RepID=UPI000B368127|nr:BACON domain-containing carbohydrate-binding protein [Alistipes sp. An116]OUQ54294.1 hypothetical protein B5E60_02945 [Alistipes sp. An116]